MTAVLAVGILTASLYACQSFSDAGPGPEKEAGDGATASSPYAAAILADAPIAYWRMGTTSGPFVHDETGRQNDLILQGGAGAFVLGVAGAIVGDDDTAIRFDGREGNALVTDAGPFDFANRAPFTIELWAKRDALEGGSTYQYMMSREQGSDANKTGFSLQTYVDSRGDGGGTAAFEYNAYDGGDQRVTGGSTSIGEWNHFVGVFNGTDVTVYVDGTLGETKSAKGAMTVSMLPLFVAGVKGNAFAGAIDEVAIYDRALTLTQIVAHRALGRP